VRRLTLVDVPVDLRADCSSCFALCCTAFGFSRSADFPVDKPAGTPCDHLAADHSCTIHAHLRGRGFRGCLSFDCFGAGQSVSQHLFAGRSWREQPHVRHDMFATFAVLRHVHEMLWYLDRAGRLPITVELRRDLVEHTDVVVAAGRVAEKKCAAQGGGCKPPGVTRATLLRVHCPSVLPSSEFLVSARLKACAFASAIALDMPHAPR